MSEPRASYYDQEDEVDEVVKGVCIHHKVHDVHPALQSDDLQGEEKIEERKPLLSSSDTLSIVRE